MYGIYTKWDLRGRLTNTLIENEDYKWVNRLALLDEDGCLLCSDTWQTNHCRRAHKDLKSMGWTKEGK